MQDLFPMIVTASTAALTAAAALSLGRLPLDRVERDKRELTAADETKKEIE